MEESILNTIEALVGVNADYTAFDVDIITSINTALATLHELGVGPTQGMQISHDTSVWSEFVESSTLLGLCKQYISLKTRLIFDPPTNSTVIENINGSIRELEWRIVNHNKVVSA